MSEHIRADEAQALLDAATQPGPVGWQQVGAQVERCIDGWCTVVAECDKVSDAALIAAAPRLAAEVVRLRRELDARTDPELATELRGCSCSDVECGHPDCRMLRSAADLLDLMLGGGE